MKEIPILNIGNQGFDCLLDDYSHYLDIILEEAKNQYTVYGLKTGDVLSKSWAKKSNILYRDELEKIADRVGIGAWMLNFSYEFGCTTAGFNSDSPKLLRVLDWDLNGLGKTILAVKKNSPAGKWVNLTWAGFVGCVQGIAPGRFSAAINHAPPSDTGMGFHADWIAGKAKIWNNKGMPPTHLLRFAFEECNTFDDALIKLMTTPICAPVFYTIVGCEKDQVALIERLPDHSVCHRYQSTAIANHWISDLPGKCHSAETVERLDMMNKHIEQRLDNERPFSWLKYPILNECTRLVFESSPSSNEIIACAYENGEQATKCTKIYF